MDIEIRPAAYWREHYRLDKMPLTDGAGSNAVTVRGGDVVRVRHDSYCLRHAKTTQRARWGTAEQIANDIAYQEAYDALHPASGKPW